MLLPKKVGPFTLMRKLDADGAAEAYVGILDDPAGKQIVARRIPPPVARDPNRMASVRARIRDLMAVRHPSLVPVLDLVEVDGDAWLVEDWLEALELRDILAYCARSNVGLPHNVYLNLATQVCNGLEALHSRAAAHMGEDHVLHLSLSPSSILVCADGRVLLSRYGITASPTTTGSSSSGSVGDDMEYLSPEQTHTDQRLTPASDIFSLGAILYELLTMRPMFRAESNLQTIHKVRRAEVTTQLLEVKELLPGLDKVLFRALSLNPRHRYQRAFVLREDLRGLMAGFSFSDIESVTTAFLTPIFRDLTQGVLNESTADPATFRTDNAQFIMPDDPPSQDTMLTAIPNAVDLDEQVTEVKRDDRLAEWTQRPNPGPISHTGATDAELDAMAEEKTDDGRHDDPILFEESDTQLKREPEHAPSTRRGRSKAVQFTIQDPVAPAYSRSAQEESEPVGLDVGFTSPLRPARKPSPTLAPLDEAVDDHDTNVSTTAGQDGPLPVPPGAWGGSGGSGPSTEWGQTTWEKRGTSPDLDPTDGAVATAEPPSPLLVPPGSPRAGPVPSDLRPTDHHTGEFVKGSLRPPTRKPELDGPPTDAIEPTASARWAEVAPNEETQNPPTLTVNPTASFVESTQDPHTVRSKVPLYDDLPAQAPAPGEAEGTAWLKNPASSAPLGDELTARGHMPSQDKTVAQASPPQGTLIPPEEPLLPPPEPQGETWSAAPAGEPLGGARVAPSPAVYGVEEGEEDDAPAWAPYAVAGAMVAALFAGLLCIGVGIGGPMVLDSLSSNSTAEVRGLEPIEGAALPQEGLGSAEAAEPDAPEIEVAEVAAEPEPLPPPPKPQPTAPRPTPQETYEAVVRTTSPPPKPRPRPQPTGGLSTARPAPAPAPAPAPVLMPSPSDPPPPLPMPILADEGTADAAPTPPPPDIDGLFDPAGSPAAPAPPPDDLDRLSTSAFNGKLSAGEQEQLAQVATDDPDFTRARTLLYLDAKARDDAKARQSHIALLMTLPANRYNPVLLVEEAQEAADREDWPAALKSARSAEQHWARIPPELVYTRKALIYEIMASSHTGQFYASEGTEVEMLDQAIRDWERFRAHVSTKDRPELIQRADKKLERLHGIKKRVE
ncbi:MAG: protein kinase [Myxococcales bacterium]|nr:protein kinase [Myxococcales bacterium]